MSRRNKFREPAQPGEAAGTNKFENITKLQNQVMTRSRRRALETLSPNTLETDPCPAKKDCRGPEAPLCGGARSEESPDSEVAVGATPSSEVELVLQQYKGVQRTLGSKCLDVVDRLKLDYAPRCALRRSFCRTHHWETCAPVRLAEEDLKSKTLHFLRQERYPNFIKFVEDMCIRDEFPGGDVIAQIWNLILTVRIPDHEDYSSNWVIDECVFLFEKIISKFPPCWSAIRESYTKLLTIPISNENVLPSRNASTQTILQFLILKLSEVIKEEPKQQRRESKKEIFNVHEWEMKNKSNQNFEAFPREQKLDRLFIVLHQVVKVLELDLAAWIPQHVAKPRKHMIGAEKPLVCSVFGFDQCTHITNLVKQTLDVYVSCVCFSFPPKQMAYLSRLVSLLAVVINLCEISTTKELTYPNIGQLTIDFAKEICKAIDGLVGKKIEQILIMIKNIKIPFVKYLLIDELLCKLNGGDQEMNAKKVIDIFRKQIWLECELARQKNQLPTRSVPELKYPIIPKKIFKPTSTVLYREEYLDLLLEALRAYCDFYAINDIAKLFAPKKPNKPSGIQSKNPGKAIDCSEELASSPIEDDITAVVDQMDLKQQLPPKVEEPQCFEAIHVDANVMKQYRSELKWLLILRKNIPVLRERHGNIFDKFYDFTENELFGND